MSEEVKVNVQRRNKVDLFPYLAVFPALLLLITVLAYPSAYSVYISFLRYKIMLLKKGTPFIGFGNYVFMLTDPEFWASLWRTFYFVFWALFWEIILSLGLAIVVAKPLKGIGIIRGIILLPWMIAPAAAAVMWAWLLEGSYGMINHMLLKAGLIKKPIIWLSTVGLSMNVIIWIDIWREVPVITMIFVAGLQGISYELYEAARIDGANAWQQFWNITLPLLKPAILLALILRTMIALRIFDLVFILTGGGPGGTTEVLGTYIYRTAFSGYDLGGAASLSIILLIITLGISIVYIKMLPKEVA
ncbi:MAG: carbohydrate ABC transporter permease [bacterium]